MIGTFLLLLTTTAALTQEEINTEEVIPLTASIMYEQYENGRLYNTHFEAPYNRHLCQPRKIHLSPSSDIDRDSGLYSATVSFTLDFTDTIREELFMKDAIRTRVTYGRGDSQGADRQASAHRVGRQAGIDDVTVTAEQVAALRA